VAAIAGWVMERGNKTFKRALSAGFLAEIVLFVGGLGWLTVLTGSPAQAVRMGLYWFVFAELIKILMAAAVSLRAKQWMKQ
jgi:biotin transporter BioY